MHGPSLGPHLKQFAQPRVSPYAKLLSFMKGCKSGVKINAKAVTARISLDLVVGLTLRH